MLAAPSTFACTLDVHQLEGTATVLEVAMLNIKKLHCTKVSHVHELAQPFLSTMMSSRKYFLPLYVLHIILISTTIFLSECIIY